MPALFGIIGFPLAHSFSPAYFKKKFAEQNTDAVYEPFLLNSIEEFPALLQANPTIEGLNVTIPYKEAVLPYLDELDNVAAEIGAVNCIVFKNGKTKGYNTDIIGFEQSLNPLLQPQHTHAMILGTGGSSKAVAYVLKQLGIAYQFVSRVKQNNYLVYEELTPEIIDRHKLIINTTSLGMYPSMESAPALPYNAIGAQHLLYDLIYNPEETVFLTRGKDQGAAIKNGFEMLQLQADASWDIWAIGRNIPE
ncbi:MAG: shikimate dehydrogenase [Flavipsychrobacter sp.]|jgi:shikimate dehydrogenase|nr:shikimate dehydrogenase [Flavipsychrobacter sp.]